MSKILYFLPSPIFSASAAEYTSTVFSVLNFQSGVVVFLMIVLFKFPSSSHSSSISIFVLSPFSVFLESHSFCGGALRVEMGNGKTQKDENKQPREQTLPIADTHNSLFSHLLYVPSLSRIGSAHLFYAGGWCCLCRLVGCKFTTTSLHGRRRDLGCCFCGHRLRCCFLINWLFLV